MERIRGAAGLLLIAVVAQAPAVAAQDGGVIVVRGATIHTAAGGPIARGTIVLRDGRIAAIGTNVAVPAGARVIDATGKD
ncbi:MAG: hypothetical protein R2882_12120, partial [Gemmatimonadales bacterium]